MENPDNAKKIDYECTISYYANGFWRCDKCFKEWDYKQSTSFKYCPNCGRVNKEHRKD